LCRPFLFKHALVENDLLFVLKQLKDLARLIQERVTQRHRLLPLRIIGRRVLWIGGIDLG